MNNRIAINVRQRYFKKRNVRFIVGDWTKPMRRQKFLIYGRNGVPIYVYYGAPDEKTGERPEPQLLPQLLTPGIPCGVVGLDSVAIISKCNKERLHKGENNVNHSYRYVYAILAAVL